MNKDDQEQALASIHHYVWSGYYDADEIAEIICEELFEPATVNKSWVIARIAEEFSRKHLDEQAWPHPTDCERLDAVFAELTKNNIIALPNAGYTQSDGIDDISEIWHNAGGKSSPIVGYCFFHGQDLERAVAGEGLMLTFGDILGTDEKGLIVGKTIVNTLSKHCFQSAWEGTIAERINIPVFQWRKSSV